MPSAPILSLSLSISLLPFHSLTVIIKVLLVVRLRPLRLMGNPGGRRNRAVRGIILTAGAGRAQEQRRTTKGQLQRVHPTLARRLTRRTEDQVSGRQRLHNGTHGLLVRAARCPNRLLHRMEQLEAEAVLLARPLNHLARRQQNRAHPVAALRLRVLVEQQQARL